MTSERWARVTQIVNDCLEHPGQEREALVRAASGNDDELFGEVMRWIDTAEQTSGFLEAPINIDVHTLEAGADTIARRIDKAFDWTNRQLGAYRITQEIARGGMGGVFKAVRADDQYQKQVAIKTIRPGMDSSLVIERFKAERQILANLDHPNIARLIDGGTTEEGIPYLVMEYVEGLAIDTYCDSKSLPINERLALFRTVCSAVHFAHQRLVVHRDLKPSNILVDEQAQVKLLDFGIAKLLDPTVLDDNGKAQANPTIANAMTPAYASPEQIKGEAITTSSDVYALGVLLYRLLTGKSPYKNDTTKPLELAKEIVDTDPERPSTVVTRSVSPRPSQQSVDTEKVIRTLDTKRLQRELKGDLDNIILMALRKDPLRRYASVEQFSADVNHHLNDLPVIARANTFVYRAKKFVQRNTLLTTLSVVALFTLVGGVIATSHQANIARQAQARAEQHFASVRKLANSNMFDVHDAIKDLPGATPAREILVKNATQYLDQLSLETNDPALAAEIASGYDRLADVQGGWRAANLGDSSAAERSFRKSIMLREKVAAANAGDVDTRRALIVSYGKLSDLLMSLGNSQEALRFAGQAVATSEYLVTRPDAALVDRMNVGRGRFSLAFKQLRAGETDAAMASLDAALNELDELARAFPNDDRLRRVTTAAFNQAGVLNMTRDRLPQAITLLTRAQTLIDATYIDQPNNTSVLRMRAYVRQQLGEARWRAHQISLDEVLDTQRKSLAEMSALADADTMNWRFVSDVALAQQLVADKLARAGSVDEALRFLDMALAANARAYTQDPSQTNVANLETTRFQLVRTTALAVEATASPAQLAQASARCKRVEALKNVTLSATVQANSESIVVLPDATELASAFARAKLKCRVTS